MTQTPKRLAPSKDPLIQLFALSGNQCAFPGCNQILIDEDSFVAQVCHIEAAMPGGERYNESSNNEERRMIQNLVLLCYPHHIKTNNIDNFPTPVLRKLKTDHEAKFRIPAQQYQANSDIINNIYNDLLKRIQQDINIIRKDTSAIKEDTGVLRDDSQKIMNMIQKLSEGNQKNQTSYSQDIGSAMNWRKSNQHKTAIQLLEVIKNEKWDKLTNHDKYSVLANIGICYMELQESSIASEHLISALSFEPEMTRAITLAAVGYAMQGEVEKCEQLVAKVLKNDPQNIEAFSALTVLYRGKSNLSEVLSRIPEDLRKNPEIAFGLAQIAKTNAEYSEAIKWAQIALDNAKGEKAEFKSILASMILESIHNPFDILTDQVSQDGIIKARYVVQLYQEAWEEIRGTQIAKSRSWWLVNSSVAKKITKDLKGSYEDLIEATKVDDNYVNLKQLAITYVQLEDYDKAFQTILKMEELSSNEDLEEIELFKAEVRVLEQNLLQAQEILLKLLETCEHPQILKHAKYLLLSIYVKQDKIELAKRLNLEMINDDPSSILPYVHQAKFLRQENKTDEVISCLERAAQQITKNSNAGDLHDLAIEWTKEKRNNEAILIYEKITDLDVYSDLTRELLQLYYWAGETRKLLETCNNLIEINGPNNVLTEFQCVTYESLNDLKSAVASCLNYLSIYPDDQRISVHLALIYFKMNDIQELAKVLEGIKNVDKSLPLDVQYKVARLFFEVGNFEKFCETSFVTWKDKYNQKESHEWFLGVLLGTGSSIPHPENPLCVSDQSAIIIRDVQNKEIKFLISPKGSEIKLPEEISSDSKIAKLVIGKREGEKFCTENTDPNKEFIIIKILHKHNYAYRESTRLISEKFIDSNAFRTYTFGNTGDPAEDMKPLYTQVDRIADSEKELNQLYESGKMPLGIIASFKKENPIKVWSSYTAWHMPGIYTTNGVEEIDIGSQCLQQGQGMLIDIISLHTLTSIDMLDELAKLPNKKAISQSSVNHLNDLIKEYRRNSEGIMSLGKINGQYVKFRITKEEIAEYLKILEKQMAWVNANCDILPCLEAINMLAHQKRQFDELLEKSFAESVLTAKEQGYLLFSEESSLRAFAFGEYKIDGLNTFMLINFLKATNQITAEKYNSSLIKLIGLNYKLIPCNSDVILGILEKTMDVEHPQFQLAIEGLKSDLRNGEQTISTCLVFFDKLYSNMSINTVGKPDQFKQIVINTTLNVLTSHYQPTELVKLTLIQGINRCFINRDMHKTEVIQVISKYFDDLEI